MRALPILALLCACAPRVDGPVAHQRAIDRADADRLAVQLGELPGAVRAQVTLHRAVVDPFTHARTPAGAAAVIVVDDRADRAAVAASARALVHATAPDIPQPAIAVEVGAVRPRLARVGPFTVDARSRPALLATLAAALVAIAALGGWIAWREWQRGR